MVRGGPFRSAFPLVGQRDLNDVFEAVNNKIQGIRDFGVYDRLTRSQAASAQGLHHNAKLLNSIIAFCPAAEIQDHHFARCDLAVSSDERLHIEEQFVGSA